MENGYQRLVALNGESLSEENLTNEAAKHRHKALIRKSVSHRWQAWCGQRTGWNSVSAWWNRDDAAQGLSPAEQKRPVGRPRKIRDEALAATLQKEEVKAKRKVDGN